MPLRFSQGPNGRPRRNTFGNQMRKKPFARQARKQTVDPQLQKWWNKGTKQMLEKLVKRKLTLREVLVAEKELEKYPEAGFADIWTIRRWPFYFELMVKELQKK